MKNIAVRQINVLMMNSPHPGEIVASVVAQAQIQPLSALSLMPLPFFSSIK